MLATDVYLERPQVGQSTTERWRAMMLGTTEVQRFAKGTRASEMPEWVWTAKALDANGAESDEHYLGDHVWIDEPEPAAPPAARQRGITLTGGVFGSDGSFTPFATEQLFHEGAA